jgi:type I restriction enzyme M protein
MTTFEEIFEELAKYNDRSVIWNNWLDFVIKINLINHNGKETNFYNNENKYMELMEAWLNELTDNLETEPYYDILGQFYEELVQSRSKSKSLGQIYTPPSVSDLLSEISIDADDNKKGISYDPTCGSGRTLMAAHVHSQGDLICIGQDLDLTSCHMAVLNFFSHGVRGSILHMDTLEETFYQGWRVNKYLYHGIPVPHIEEIYTVRDAFDFFELKNRNGPENVGIENNDNVVEKTTSIFKPKGTGQTTLM